MARIRTVKPTVAKHEVLFEAEQATGLPLRFAWVMLFTVCDREGRFPWRPRELKTDVLPYDEIDFKQVLDAFAEVGLIVRYDVEGEAYGYIPTWKKHQAINQREADSTIPPPLDTCMHVHARGEGKGREGKGKEGKEYSTEPLRDSAPTTTSPTVLEFPTIGAGGSVWRLTEAQVAEWMGLYPGLAILAEAQKALAWVKATPGRKRTPGGMARFLVGWFNRATDASRGGGTHHVTAAPNARGGHTFGPWVCPHVDTCGNPSTCGVKLASGPQRWPVRPGVAVVVDAHGVPRAREDAP